MKELFDAVWNASAGTILGWVFGVILGLTLLKVAVGGLAYLWFRRRASRMRKDFDARIAQMFGRR